MSAVLFDTSVYVTALRTAAGPPINLRRLDAGSAIWLSALVLAELYAGAHSRDTKIIEHLEYDFTKVKRILTPNLKDWTTTGRVLARFSSAYDYEATGKVRLMNDALLAMSAARQGITIITANQRDFARLAALHPFLWRGL
jgi:predicted nucleic acid-binding protein